MPKLIVSIDGVVIKEVQLTKDRTSVGRRPYNDVVIDNLAVSGEHAVLLVSGNEVQIEDLNSTNGTYVNSKAVRKQVLRNNDLVEIGKYKIKFLHEGQEAANYEKTMVYSKGSTPAAGRPEAPMRQRRAFDQGANAPEQEHVGAGTAAIKVVSGAAAGREVALAKVVTTIGKPGVAVAAITRRPHGYVVVHVEGADPPLLNGDPVGTTPVGLKNGDLLQLAGTQMQFVQTS